MPREHDEEQVVIAILEAANRCDLKAHRDRVIVRTAWLWLALVGLCAWVLIVKLLFAAWV